MNTLPWAMAADDLTGPAVLKLQSKPSLSGKRHAATPNKAGPPRNIGQSALELGAWPPVTGGVADSAVIGTDAPPSHSNTKTHRAACLRLTIRIAVGSPNPE